MRGPASEASPVMPCLKRMPRRYSLPPLFFWAVADDCHSLHQDSSGIESTPGEPGAALFEWLVSKPGSALSLFRRTNGKCRAQVLEDLQAESCLTIKSFWIRGLTVRRIDEFYAWGQSTLKHIDFDEVHVRSSAQAPYMCTEWMCHPTCVAMVD